MKTLHPISIVIGAVALPFLDSPAHASCDSLRWRGGLELRLGFDAPPSASASIDHDGDGERSLFVAGSGAASGTGFQGLVRLVNARWEPFGPSFTGSVAKLERFDLDGDGTPSFILLGAMRLDPTGPVYGMLEWSGSSWIGRSVNQQFGDALTIDADGDGEPTLVASLRFAASGVQPLVRWTPAGWVPLTPKNSIANATPQSTGTIVLAAHDSDGDGRQELFAPVNVGAGGSSIATGMARWNGSSWASVGGAPQPPVLTQGVLSMCVADTDGDGAAELVVAGQLAPGAGGGSQVVALRGGGWAALGGTFFRALPSGNVSTAVQRVASVDLGAGGGPSLFATGMFSLIDGASVANLARWNGTAWVDAGGGFPGANIGASRGLLGHDVDADGSAELVAVGNFLRAGSATVNRVAAYDGVAWGAVGSAAATRGLNDGASTAVLFDHDGDGRESLVVGGYFTQAGGMQAASLAAFDGGSWEPLANPWVGGVEALLVADLDGDGVPSLYAAGDTGAAYDPFTTARTVAEYVPSKGGGAWTQLGGSLNAQVATLAAVDHDLDGQPSLFAGGFFSQLGGVTVGKLVRWTGSTWASLNPGQGQSVNAVVSFDDDDDGVPSMIVALGDGNPSSVFQRVRKWNGASWSNIGLVNQGHVFALQVLDHDGDGKPSLFSFGQFVEGAGVAWVQRLQTGFWASFGPVASFGTYEAGGSLARFDDDGDGTETLFLVNGDPFTGIAASVHRFEIFAWEKVASDLGAIDAPGIVADLEADGTRSLHVVGQMSARANRVGSNIGIIDPCVDVCVGDIDGDGAVDAVDLADMLSSWGPCGAACGADLNRSGGVDAFDLALLLSAWGPCP